MQVNFPAPKEKPVQLGKVLPGSIVRFADSSRGAQTLAHAQVAPQENLFIVFSEESDRDKKYVFCYTNLMSVDGKHISRRQNDRLVVVHEVESHTFSGVTQKALESLDQGAVVLYGISEKGFAAKNQQGQREFLYVVTKDTPVTAGRIPLVSLTGKKIFLDDDRMVLALDDFVLNFK